MKRRQIFWLASLLGLAFILVQSVAFISRRVAAAGGKPKRQVQERARQSDRVTLHAAGRGNPWINLRDGHDLLTTYAGAEIKELLDLLQPCPADLMRATPSISASAASATTTRATRSGGWVA